MGKNTGQTKEGVERMNHLPPRKGGTRRPVRDLPCFRSCLRLLQNRNHTPYLKGPRCCHGLATQGKSQQQYSTRNRKVDHQGAPVRWQWRAVATRAPMAGARAPGARRCCSPWARASLTKFCLRRRLWRANSKTAAATIPPPGPSLNAFVSFSLFHHTCCFVNWFYLYVENFKLTNAA